MQPATNNLDEIFFPRNVAAIGASTTNFYTIALMQGKLRDHLFLINPNYREIHGRKCYASILDIEDPIDYVILALPSAQVLNVVQSDMCVRAGLAVRPFSAKAVEALREFVPVSGTMIGNPLDAWQLFYKYSDDEATLKDVLRIASEESGVHAIIVQFDVIKFMLNMWKDEFEKYFAGVAERLLEGCRYARDKKGKPVFLSMFLDPYSDSDLERRHNLAFKNRCESEGFPVFPALRDAVGTMGRAYAFTQMRKGRGPSIG